MKEPAPPSPDMVDEIVDGFAAELPAIDSDVLEAVCRLISAGKTFEQHAAAQLKPYEFNYTGFDVLGMLRSSGPPYELTPADLIRFTMITSGAMTTCLDRLEAAGMVRRRISEKDRRVRVVTLTEKGKRLIEEALALRFSEAGRTLSGLARKDLQALNRTLRELGFGAG